MLHWTVLYRVRLCIVCIIYWGNVLARNVVSAFVSGDVCRISANTHQYGFTITWLQKPTFLWWYSSREDDITSFRGSSQSITWEAFTTITFVFLFRIMYNEYRNNMKLKSHGLFPISIYYVRKCQIINKIWWLGLVPTSTIRWLVMWGTEWPNCDMVIQGIKLWTMTYNSLIENEEHNITSQILKTIFGLHASVIIWPH